MSDPVMLKEYPDQKQRAAICYRQSGEKPKVGAGDIPDRDGDEGFTDKLVVPRKGGDPVPLKLNKAAKKCAMKMVRMGKVDDKSAWSWDDAEAQALLMGDKSTDKGGSPENWKQYGNAHLALNMDPPPKNKERYQHPFAKAREDGVKVHVAGLRAIKRNASLAGEKEIEEAAAEILDEIEKKKLRGKLTDPEPDPEDPEEESEGEDAEAEDDAEAGNADQSEEEDDREDGATNPDEKILRKARKGLERADSKAEPFAIRAQLHIEAAGESSGPEKPPRFYMVANTGKRPMRLEGWKHPVVMDLSGMSIPRQSRPVRLHHDSKAGVGHTDYIGINADGELEAKGVISRHTEAARDVVESGKKGFPWQASVGASAEEVEFVRAGDESPVNGYMLKGPANIVRKSTLGEISFVDIGGDDATSARVAAMAKDGITTDTTSTLDAEWGASVARAEAETNRIIAIEKLVSQYVTRPGANIKKIKEIQAAAMSEGWNTQTTELELLKASRPSSPAPRRGADEPSSAKVIEASLLMGMLGGEPLKADDIGDNKRQKIDEILAADRDFGPDVVTEAWRYRNRGLQGTIAAALAQSGVQVPYGKRELYDSILENRHVRAEGFSTVNLPGILGNVANKVLLLAFLNVESTYNIIAEQADFANFQTHTMYRLEYMGDFAVVGNDGELKNSTLGQDSYTNTLQTRGAVLTLTRQNIINDDLNAFRTLIAQLARKARIAAEKALYGVVMESANSFYTATRGNLVTSNGISITGFANAEAALTLMTDSGGEPIYATPRFVLVPPALRYYADQLYVSGQMLAAGSTSLPDDNPFKGRFAVVSSPYMQMSAMTGYSATTWYMVADPLMLPAWQIAYLDGRRAPTIETADAEFNVLGLMMRAYWDFGVAQLDYRGAVKNTA
jgi:hypothetical protein